MYPSLNNKQKSSRSCICGHVLFKICARADASTSPPLKWFVCFKSMHVCTRNCLRRYSRTRPKFRSRHRFHSITSAFTKQEVAAHEHEPQLPDIFAFTNRWIHAIVCLHPIGRVDHKSIHQRTKFVENDMNILPLNYKVGVIDFNSYSLPLF